MSARRHGSIETREESARLILVCVLLLVLLALVLLLPQTTTGRSVLTIFTGMVLMAAILASRVPALYGRIATVIVAIAVVLATLALIVGHGSSNTLFAIVMTLFTLAMPACILIGLRGERTVNIQTVFGAISLYFMFGLLYAFVITTVTRLSDTPYFAQGTDGTLSQRVYFSFVTLSTLGYGDLTPSSSVGRMLSVFESVTGSLYLVTAVSVVVSRLGHVRTTHVRNPPTRR